MSAKDVYPGTWRFDPDGEREYLLEHYENLVRFFEATAARDDAAIMNYSY